MKNPNSGYFYFGKGLGEALLRENKGRFNFTFYLFKITTLFNGLVNIIRLYRAHRLFFPFYKRFDLVHFSDQTCRLRPYRLNAKKIMTIHDINNAHLAFKSKYKVKKHIRKLKRFIAHCDRVVAISSFVANDVIHFIPEVRGKISVIYNGADKLTVPNGHLPHYLPQKKFIFTIGLLSVQKGFHLLPALLAGNNYELIISGIETPHKQNIIDAAIKAGCLDRLIITGPVSDDDKAWYYSNCSAFAFPSIAEGFGLPVIEAMHFGKPVFLSRFTCLPEIGGDVAYYFDNFEPAHMQEVFTAGMADYEANCREESIKQQAKKFSWQIAARQYMQLYKECLEE